MCVAFEKISFLWGVDLFHLRVYITRYYKLSWLKTTQDCFSQLSSESCSQSYCLQRILTLVYIWNLPAGFSQDRRGEGSPRPKLITLKMSPHSDTYLTSTSNYRLGQQHRVWETVVSYKYEALSSSCAVLQWLALAFCKMSFFTSENIGICFLKPPKDKQNILTIWIITLHNALKLM